MLLPESTVLFNLSEVGLSGEKLKKLSMEKLEALELVQECGRS